MPHRERLANLTMHRESLAKRIKAGEPGVVELRTRLRIATHEVMALKLWIGKNEGNQP